MTSITDVYHKSGSYPMAEISQFTQPDASPAYFVDFLDNQEPIRTLRAEADEARAGRQSNCLLRHQGFRRILEPRVSGALNHRQWHVGHGDAPSANALMQDERRDQESHTSRGCARRLNLPLTGRACRERTRCTQFPSVR